MGEVYIIAKKISDFLEGIKPMTWKYQLDITTELQELQLSWVMFTYKVFLCTSSVLVVNCGLNNVIFYLM